MNDPVKRKKKITQRINPQTFLIRGENEKKRHSHITKTENSRQNNQIFIEKIYVKALQTPAVIVDKKICNMLPV